MTSRVKGALLLIVAFLLGAAAGALGFGIYQVREGRWGPHRGARFQQVVLGRLTSELDLKPDQRQQVEAVLRETGEEFARLRLEMAPRFREIRERARGRIQAVLDPGQRPKFDALVERWERQAERRRGETPGAGGEPAPRRP